MEILLDELTHLLTMKQHKHIRITSSERVSIYIPVCACMEGKGHGKYSILHSLYACVSQQPLASVVMTVMLSQRCFDSLSKHKLMWLGWRQANTAGIHVLHPKPSAIPPPNFAYNLSILKTFCDI